MSSETFFFCIRERLLNELDTLFSTLICLITWINWLLKIVKFKYLSGIPQKYWTMSQIMLKIIALYTPPSATWLPTQYWFPFISKTETIFIAKIKSCLSYENALPASSRMKQRYKKVGEGVGKAYVKKLNILLQEDVHWNKAFVAKQYRTKHNRWMPQYHGSCPELNGPCLWFSLGKPWVVASHVPLDLFLHILPQLKPFLLSQWLRLYCEWGRRMRQVRV